MTTDLQTSRTLSSVAAVFSAFFVFLLGGGVVLKVWVDQRDTIQGNHTAKAEAEGPVEKAETVPVETRTKPVASASKRSTAKPKTARVPESTPVPEPTEPSAAEGSSARPPVSRTGRGTVMVMGGATRVRLMGSKGTFGPGTVPAGSYTIQATFSGSDPRMAGTVEVNDGQRLVVTCSASSQKCVQQ